MFRDLSARGALALVGAVVALLAAFLPWQRTPGGTVSGAEGLGIVVLVVGGLAAGAVLLAEWTEQGVVAATLAGGIVVAVTLVTLSGLGGPVTAGAGLYLALFGGVGLLGAGLWGLAAGEWPDALG